jgi:hypothetical protein
MDTISNNINGLLQNNMSSSADLNQQNLIDKALVDAGLPQNKLNSLIDSINDNVMCDTACQQQRTGDKYKQKWELAKKKYKQAPEEIRLAEKNYYVYDKGYTAYNDMLFDRYAKTAAEFKATSNAKHEKVNAEIQELIDAHSTGGGYLQRMNDLLRIKLKEQERLKREIDQYMKRTQTNGRKVVYEDRARNGLGTIYYILLFLHFALLVLYIVFGRFIPTKAYADWKTWLLIALYISFPFFLLPSIIWFIYFLINYIKSWRLPKNIYRHL